MLDLLNGDGDGAVHADPGHRPALHVDLPNGVDGAVLDRIEVHRQDMALEEPIHRQGHGDPPEGVGVAEAAEAAEAAGNALDAVGEVVDQAEEIID